MTHKANSPPKAATQITTKEKRRKDPTATPRGEREITTRKTHKTSQPSRETGPTPRQHTREVGNVDPLLEGNNNANKAHEHQHIGKETPGKDHAAQRKGSGETHGADRLPLT